jgi:hypothetical protein
VDVAVAVEEPHDDNLLQTLAELISAPSLELLVLRSAHDTGRRMDFASNATRRGIMSASARNGRARSRSTRPTSRNDDGMAVLRMSWSNLLHLLAIVEHP